MRPMINVAPVSALFLANAISTPPPARCHIGAGWNDGHGAGLHLSSLTEPLLQHRIRNTASSFNGRMLCFFWSNAGSNPVEARWAQWPHAKKLGSRMGAVRGRRHEPAAGLESLCPHGPSAVPHAGTVFLFHASPLPAGRGLFSSRPGDAYPRA